MCCFLCHTLTPTNPRPPRLLNLRLRLRVRFGVVVQPLALLLLLRRLEQRGHTCIVFAGSVDGTHRLTRLLQLFGGVSHSGDVVEFSAKLPQARRAKIINQVRRWSLSAPSCTLCSLAH